MGALRLKMCLFFLLTAFFLPSLLPAQNFGSGQGDRENEIRSIDRSIALLKANRQTPEEDFNIAYDVLKRSIAVSYTRGKAESYLNIGVYFVDKRKHAQAIRSLLSALQLFKALGDTVGLMRVYHSLFSVEIYLKDYKNALETCGKGLELARQQKNMLETGFFLEKMADVFHEQQDVSKAMDYYLESLKYFADAKDRPSVYRVYMSIGGIYLDQEKYDDVIRLYDTVSALADSVDPATAGTMYTRLAHVYSMRQDYATAVKYNRKALETRKRAKFSDAENSSLINIAGDFFRMNLPDSGWFYLNKGLALAKRHNRVYYLKNGYNVLYKYYMARGDLEQALVNLKLMLAMNDSIMQERLNTDPNVIKTVQNAAQIKESIKLLERQHSIQEMLIRNEKIFKILFFALVLAVLIAVGIIVRINLRHRRSKRNIVKLNVKLQHEAAERKLVQKKTIEKEDQYRFIAEHSLDLISRIDKNFKITYASPAAAEIFGFSPGEMITMNILDMVLPGYHDYLREQLAEVVASRRPHSIAILARKKGNEPVWIEITVNPVFDPKTGAFREFVSVTRNIQELKKREMGIVEGTKQKENLLREIHHRVKNNFAILVSLINMQKAQSQNEDVKQSLTNLQLRIRTMALVHEMLYRSEDFEKISFPDYVRSVASVVSSTYGKMNVHLDFKLDPVIINIETAIPLGLILNELLSNAYRHAFSDTAKGSITLGFTKHNEPNIYALSVSDTGAGLPEGFSMEGSKTMGLQIVEILVKQIEAHLLIEKTNGTSFTIIFPLEA